MQHLDLVAVPSPAPLLVLAYNRPAHLQRLVDRLRVLRPPTVLIAVDGPRPGRPGDSELVSAVHSVARTIDWTDDVHERFRDENLGLRAAVADAVGWAVAEYGRVIVVEDDTEPGDAFLPYMHAVLDRFEDDERVEHISGYNLVPPARLRSQSAEGSRLTIYPESFAWATWERAWRHYDPDMEWGRNATVRELAEITGSRTAGVRWKQHFEDAARERISTWAYRWIASMWSRRSLVVSPNANLVTYTGYDDGTHTLMNAPWSELPRYDGDPAILLTGEVQLDPDADRWVGRTVFGESAFGVVRGEAISLALSARLRLRTARLRAR